jgi:hypothetical protein
MVCFVASSTSRGFHSGLAGATSAMRAPADRGGGSCIRQCLGCSAQRRPRCGARQLSHAFATAGSVPFRSFRVSSGHSDSGISPSVQIFAPTFNAESAEWSRTRGKNTRTELKETSAFSTAGFRSIPPIPRFNWPHRFWNQPECPGSMRQLQSGPCRMGRREPSTRCACKPGHLLCEHIPGRRREAARAVWAAVLQRKRPRGHGGETWRTRRTPRTRVTGRRTIRIAIPRSQHRAMDQPSRGSVGRQGHRRRHRVATVEAREAPTRRAATHRADRHRREARTLRTPVRQAG